LEQCYLSPHWRFKYKSKRFLSLGSTTPYSWSSNDNRDSSTQLKTNCQHESNKHHTRSTFNKVHHPIWDATEYVTACSLAAAYLAKYSVEGWVLGVHWLIGTVRIAATTSEIVPGAVVWYSTWNNGRNNWREGGCDQNLAACSKFSSYIE
jgi:hypothetical protein